MEDFYDPIYKGCTSPSMVQGVPLLPCVVVTGLTLVLAAWAFMWKGAAGVAPLAIVYAWLFKWARDVGKHDDHRVLQLWKRQQMRGGLRRAIAYWGAATFSPGRVKGQRE